MLTQDQARGLALRAQGFGRSYDEPAEVLRHLGAIQLDSVNVVARSHDLTVFSRFGPYDPAALVERIYSDRAGFEYWGHSASWITMPDYPLFLHRMARMRELGRGATTVNKDVRDEHAALYQEVLARIDAEGPLDASQFSGERPDGGWFNHKPVKRVLEDLFDQGTLTCSGRTAGFARQYDRPERFLPPEAPTTDPGIESAARELVLRSVRRLGVATAKEVAEYYRLHRWKAPWREALAAVVADGQVAEVAVDGWRGVAHADPAALDGPMSAPTHPPTLLSPLDNLLWDRPRVKRLFGFEHTFEIYKKPEQRRYGYYVLPLLVDGRLAGRADLKHDRQADVLQVHGLWLEGAGPGDATVALGRLGKHLGVGEIAVGRVEPSHEAAAVRAEVALGADVSPGPL